MLEIDGVGRSLILTILSETGFDLKSKFPSQKHYVSWLALCPNKKTSGGKTISSKTKKVKNNSAVAYRQAAINVSRKKDSALASFFNSIAYRKGRKSAVTATARKLAVIVYKMLETKQPFNPQNIEAQKEQIRRRKIKNIKKAMQKMEISIDELNLV